MDLPNELMLMIFSNLSGKEMQRARRVCSHFRDLIDLKTNQTLLLGPGLNRAHARLASSIQAITTPLSEPAPDLLSVLTSVANHMVLYDDFHDESEHQDLILRITTQLYASHHPALLALEHQSPDRDEMLLEEIHLLAHWMLLVHLRICEAARRGRSLNVAKCPVPRSEMPGPFDPYDIGNAKRQEWLWKLVTLRSGLSQPSKENFLLSQAEEAYFLTTSHEVVNTRHQIAMISDVYSPNQFSDILGLPRLPEMDSVGGCHFTLATKTLWAWKHFKNRLSSEWCPGTVQDLAALEELYIH